MARDTHCIGLRNTTGFLASTHSRAYPRATNPWSESIRMTGIKCSRLSRRHSIRRSIPRLEYRIVLPDGTLKYAHSIGHPVLNADGDLVEILGTTVDITEHKRTEEVLRRIEAYLAEAQRLTHTGSWAGDGLLRPLYWSEEHYRIFGLDPQQGLPTREQPLERIHPDDRGAMVQAFETGIRGKVDFEAYYRIVLPDGTIKYVHGIGHPVLNANGELVEVIGTTVDITERKRAEEERARLRHLETELAHINRVSIMGELTASIAHEVNQPLSGVVSNGSACLRWLAGDTPNIEEARETARRIVRDGKRAAEIIGRIRALTKRTATPREKLDLNETIREILQLVGDEAKKKSVTIRTCFADDIFPVLGDRVQLQQVVLNLVMNGIEAMNTITERAREVVITSRNIDSDQVEVTVEDSGTGLDPEASVRIYDAFYTTKPAGMGMGLSICRSILQAHDGRLWATANHGAGTTFHFALPKEQELMQNLRESRPVIAIVDDDPSVREGLHSLIRSAGWSVETFASAQEFLARPRAKAPSCLILDLQLPDLSGLDLQKRMAATNLEIPIVFLTGHGDIPASVQAMKAGAVEFLTKPVDEQDLLRAIQEAIDRDRRTRQQHADMHELRSRHDSLTAREREVMQQVISGLLNKQVAAELNITEFTVKIHRGQVMRKMHADSLADLVRMAESLGIRSHKR